jgi:phage terminase large subunit GpA-like protein
MLPGDPTRPEVWQQLDEYLRKPIENSFGVPMRILSVAVDSGYLTDDVLNYTRLRQNLGVFAIKGASQRGRQILGRPSKVDVNWKGAV